MTEVWQLPWSPGRIGNGQRMPRGAHPMQALSVIVAEDDEELSCLLKELLERAGHRVTAVRTGEEAYQEACAQRPDVIICDIGLSGEWDGYRLAETIRRSATVSSIRLVALTGYGGIHDVERAKVAGFDVHLIKPVEIETLLRVIQAE